MTVDPILDVRCEPPARRHELIFDSYSALPAGSAGQFTWRYLEQAPEVWRVRIGRPSSLQLA